MLIRRQSELKREAVAIHFATAFLRVERLDLLHYSLEYRWPHWTGLRIFKSRSIQVVAICAGVNLIGSRFLALPRHPSSCD